MKRFVLFLSLALSATALAAPASAQGVSQRARETDSTYRNVQQGNILPLNVIRERVRLDGATFIGADLISGDRYRLRYMRGQEVIWIDVDARTGRVLGRVGG